MIMVQSCTFKPLFLLLLAIYHVLTIALKCSVAAIVTTCRVNFYRQ